MGDDNKSMIEVGDLARLSKPAEKLIDKISEALGGAFRPKQIRRTAQAEADAEVIRARGEVVAQQIRTEGALDLQETIEQRAMRRLAHEEVRRQSNIESIATKAIPHVTDTAAPEKIDDDWMALFWDRSKLVSNEQMQEVWARVLAGEANEPGVFSRRTLEIVGSMTKQDAELFVTLASFGDRGFRNGTPFVFEPESPICRDRRINSISLRHLQTLGLVQMLDLTDWQIRFEEAAPPIRVMVSLFGRKIIIDAPDRTTIELRMGKVLFTQYGQELLRISDQTPAPEGMVDLLAHTWRKQGYEVTVE